MTAMRCVRSSKRPFWLPTTPSSRIDQRCRQEQEDKLRTIGPAATSQARLRKLVSLSRRAAAGGLLAEPHRQYRALQLGNSLHDSTGHRQASLVYPIIKISLLYRTSSVTVDFPASRGSFHASSLQLLTEEATSSTRSCILEGRRT